MAKFDYFLKRLEQRRIAFLFGAGTSCEATLPLMTELTKRIEENLSEESRTLFGAIKGVVKKDDPTYINIEDILNVAILLMQQSQLVLLPVVGDMKEESLQQLVRESTMWIRKELKAVTQSDYHRKFIGKLFTNRSYPDPVWFFTTNNDVLLEDALDHNRIDFENGFKGLYRRHFDVSELNGNRSNKKAYLVKLHGSITYAYENGQVIEDWSLSQNENEATLIVYPSRDKYRESHKSPYAEFQAKFRDILGTYHTLIVSGYSFSDEHINQRIYESIKSNPQLTVFVFMKEMNPSYNICNGLERIYLFTETECITYTGKEPVPIELKDCWKATELFKLITGGEINDEPVDYARAN